MATPCYRSSPAVALSWARALGGDLLGIETLASCPRSGASIAVARAQLFGAFRATEATMLLMRDDDVDPPSDVVARMLLEDVPAIVAPYLLRTPAGEPDRFDVTLAPGGGVRWAGLGCALVTRELVERLWQEYEPELGFDRNGHHYVSLCRDLFAQRDDGVELFDDDRAFWWRVAAAGYPIAALDDVAIPHAGRCARWRHPAAAGAFAQAEPPTHR